MDTASRGCNSLQIFPLGVDREYLKPSARPAFIGDPVSPGRPGGGRVVPPFVGDSSDSVAGRIHDVNLGRTGPVGNESDTSTIGGPAGRYIDGKVPGQPFQGPRGDFKRINLFISIRLRVRSIFRPSGDQGPARFIPR